MQYMYILSSLYRNSKLSSQFSNRFHDQCLADILSNFSLPVPLGDIKDIIDDEVLSMCNN